MQRSTKTLFDHVPTAAATTRLSGRDIEIIETLVMRVRTLSLPQVARTWWSGAADASVAARSRLVHLSSAGLVHSFKMLAHPEIEIREPLATWRPGLPTPDLASVSYRARARWSEPASSTELVSATTAAAERFSGHGGRRPRTSEAGHDIHLAAVFLLMKQELPTRARSWRSEAFLLAERRADRARPAASGKLPDAMVRDGSSCTAIEAVGTYSTDKLEGFHRYCESAGLGYELW
jgi:hypothetical protein